MENILYPVIYYDNIYKKYVYYYKNKIKNPRLLIRLMKIYYYNKIKDILKSIVIKLYLNILIYNNQTFKYYKYYHYYNYYLSNYLSTKEYKEFNNFLISLKIFKEKY